MEKPNRYQSEETNLILNREQSSSLKTPETTHVLDASGDLNLSRKMKPTYLVSFGGSDEHVKESPKFKETE